MEKTEHCNLYICSGRWFCFLTLHSFCQVHFSIFDLIAWWQGESVQPPSIGSAACHARCIYIQLSQLKNQISAVRPNPSAIFLGPRADRNSIWPKSCVNTWRSVYIQTPKATTFYLRWLAWQRKRRPKLRAMAGSRTILSALMHEKRRCASESWPIFVYPRWVIYFFGPANCSPIIIQTPLRALCVYKKLMYFKLWSCEIWTGCKKKMLVVSRENQM
jgi:hypothetical protein